MTNFSASDELPLAPPAGMRDLLPPDAEHRAQLASQVAATFASYGYERVATPPFEHADVLERGLWNVERRSLLRFVEPETGEVALLRPDITPQIARIVATRLRERPMPQRLCYEGTILRRRRGRARRQLQSTQAGIECVGLSGPASDAEVIEVAARAVSEGGLESFRIELHDVRVGREALAEVPESARSAAERALSAKDQTQLEQILTSAGMKREERRPLLRLPELYGDLPSVVARAQRHMKSGSAHAALERLKKVQEYLGHAGVAERLDVDLGEVRGQAYYTGVSFALLAAGPGEAIGAGGRYDALLARFGAPHPATGFALDLGHLEWALLHTGQTPRSAGKLRITLVGEGAEARAWARGLRDAGLRVTRLGVSDRAAAMKHARAWGADAVLTLGAKHANLTRTSDGKKRNLGDARSPLNGEPLAQLIKWTRAGAEAGSNETADIGRGPATNEVG